MTQRKGVSLRDLRRLFLAGPLRPYRLPPSGRQLSLFLNLQPPPKKKFALSARSRIEFPEELPYGIGLWEDTNSVPLVNSASICSRGRRPGTPSITSSRVSTCLLISTHTGGGYEDENIDRL